MRTKLCNRLGIDLPIIQAPIGGAAGVPLAAAVSGAGGLGSVTTGFGAQWRAREFAKFVQVPQSLSQSTF